MTHPSKVTPEMIEAGLNARLHDNSGRRIEDVLEPDELRDAYLAMQSTQPEAALMVTDEQKRLSILARLVGTIKGDDLLMMDPDLLALVEEYNATGDALAALTNQET